MAFAKVTGQSALVSPAIIFGDGTETITLPGSVTSGNLVVVAVCSEYSTAANRNAAVPTASNITFSRIGSTVYAPTGFICLFRGVATGAFTAITCTSTAGDGVTPANIGSDNSWIWAGEFSGNAASQTPVYSSATPSGTQTHASGSVTPSSAENLFVAVTSGTSATWTPDANFTTDANGLVSDALHRRILYRIQSAATAQNFTSTSDINRDSAVVLASFQGTGGGGSSVAPLAANYYYMGAQ
jgi:hypothetical protein